MLSLPKRKIILYRDYYFLQKDSEDEELDITKYRDREIDDLKKLNESQKKEIESILMLYFVRFE